MVQPFVFISVCLWIVLEQVAIIPWKLWWITVCYSTSVIGFPNIIKIFSCFSFSTSQLDLQNYTFPVLRRVLVLVQTSTKNSLLGAGEQSQVVPCHLNSPNDLQIRTTGLSCNCKKETSKQANKQKKLARSSDTILLSHRSDFLTCKNAGWMQFHKSSLHPKMVTHTLPKY